MCTSINYFKALLAKKTRFAARKEDNAKCSEDETVQDDDSSGSRIPAGTSRKPGLFQRLPAVSGKDYNGTGQNYAGKRKQYSRRNFPVPEPMISHIFQSPERQQMPQYPVGITMESSPYPTGNDWKQQRYPPEIIGNYNLSKTEKYNKFLMYFSIFFLV